MTRRCFTIRGRVQGVGFRWYVLRHAENLGVTGYALNQADGTVEVVAVGEDAAVLRLAELLAEGPRGAVVESVAAVEVSIDETFTGFEIRRRRD